jgi:hypothetical protein
MKKMLAVMGAVWAFSWGGVLGQNAAGARVYRGDTLYVFGAALVSDTIRTMHLLEEGQAFVGSLRMIGDTVLGYGTLTFGNIFIDGGEFRFEGNQSWKAERARFAVRDPGVPNSAAIVAHGAQVSYDAVLNEVHVLAGLERVPASIMFQEGIWGTSLYDITYKGDSQLVVLKTPDGKPGMLTAVDEDYKCYPWSARYFIPERRMELFISGINIADARISPKDYKMEIQPSGRIKPLTGARIDLPNTTRYHSFRDAEVQIQSAHQYTATAIYDYPSINGVEQGIPFSLHVEGDSMTVGEGQASAGFLLNEGMRFQGKVGMMAPRKLLHFDGQIQMLLSHPRFQNQWFDVDAEFDIDSLMVRLAPETIQRSLTGFHRSANYKDYYSTFLGSKIRPEDENLIMLSGGYLMFDRNENAFKIGPVAKLERKDLRGLSSSLDVGDNSITMSGRFDFPRSLVSKHAGAEFAGRWRFDPLTHDLTSDLVGSFTFKDIPREAWERLGDKAILATIINNGIDWNSQVIREGLAEFLDPNMERKAKNMQAFQMEAEKWLSYTDIKVPATVIPGSIALSGIRFRYDEEIGAFWHSGELGIIGIDARVFNKVTSSNSKIEYALGRPTLSGLATSDTLRIYLEFDEMNWVYFEYADQMLRTASSDIDGYNSVVNKSQGSRLQMVGEDAKDAYLSKFVNKYIWRTNRRR